MMKPCWRDAGLSEESARQAESIVEEMTALVRRVGSLSARVALREAAFRVEMLPMRTVAFQRRYKKENGNR